MKGWWNGTSTGVFRGGPLDGRVLTVPARVGMPPMVLYVAPDGSGMCAGNEYAGRAGWLRYMTYVNEGPGRECPWALVLDQDVPPDAPPAGSGG